MVELSISFLRVRSLLRLMVMLWWLRALAFQRVSWKEGKAPGERGRGQLNPLRVGIGGELFINFAIDCCVIDIMGVA